MTPYTEDPDTDDQTALREYARSASQAAFERLVRRHLAWVYSAALRQVGDPADAEDVAQAAFILLARKAAHLSKETDVSGWLFNVVRYEAKFLNRSRQRRLAHEQAAAIARREAAEARQQTPPWEEISPVLDEAVAKLSRADRKCILLRFYERMTFARVGASMSISEEAARKRVDRAIVKLRTVLDARGIQVPPTDLTALLVGGQFVHSAPANLAVTAAPLARPATSSVVMKLVAHAQRVIIVGQLKVAAALIGIAVLLIAAAAHSVVLFAANAPSQPSGSADLPIAPPATQPIVTTAIPAEPVLTTNTFSGRIVAPNGAPVPNATVWPVIPWTDHSDAKLGAPTKSAADGSFSLSVTQKVLGEKFAPSVQVIAHADGFAWTSGRVAGPRPVDIELPLPVGLRAVFVDPTGSPVQGLAVDIDSMRPSSEEAESTIRMNTDFSAKFQRITDAAGAVQWTDLPRDWSVTLNWLDPRYALPTESADTTLPDAFGAPDITIHLLPAAAIRGRITFSQNLPAAGVMLRVAGIAQVNGVDRIVNADVKSDADGNYTIPQLLPGTYSLAIANQLGDPIGKQWTAPAILAVPVTEGQTVDGQNFMLQKGAMITGAVTDAITGAPVPHVYIGIEGPAHPGNAGGGQFEETDAHGRFTARVPPGKQTVTFAYGSDLYEPAANSAPRDITVSDGQTLDVDFQAKRIDPSSGRVRHVKVVFSDGVPASGAELIFDVSNGSRSFAETDRNGECLFTPDVIPDVDFIFCARLGLLGSHSISSKTYGDTTLMLLPDFARPFTGRVLDDRGQPIDGAVIVARTLPYFRSAGLRMTAADGTFRFARMPTDSDYRIQISAQGYRRISAVIHAKNGAFPTAEFKLLPMPPSPH